MFLVKIEDRITAGSKRGNFHQLPRMINARRRVLKEDDFLEHAPSASVLLSDESRKRYFAEYERFVTAPCKLQDEAAETDFRRLFRRQAERLRDALLSGSTYYPFKFHW